MNQQMLATFRLSAAFQHMSFGDPCKRLVRPAELVKSVCISVRHMQGLLLRISTVLFRKRFPRIAISRLRSSNSVRKPKD